MQLRVWLPILKSCLVLAGVAAVGCERKDTTPAGNRTTAPAPTDATNTGRNARDRDPNATTPVDQAENQTDVRITADVRKAVMDDDALSLNAKNAKVITANGVVTLRGPVDSQAEKDSIEAKARAIAGVTNVINELEVKAPR